MIFIENLQKVRGKQVVVDISISTIHIRAGGCDEASLVMNTIETTNAGANAVQTTQPAPVHNDKDATMAFFAIGMVINVVMVTAYFIWAFKQRKK